MNIITLVMKHMASIVYCISWAASLPYG